MKIDFFNNEFSFFVFLAAFVSLRVGPADHDIASLTKDVTHTMKTCNKKSVLSWTDGNVDTVVKQIRPTMPPMETLGDNLVVTCEMCSTLSTGINLRAVQIHHRIIDLSGTSRLRLRHRSQSICEGLS
jgi:hypothetical protein